MVASVAAVGVFLVGLGVGVVVGLVVGPAIRFWLTRQEWKRASREARLTEDVLDRMDSWRRRS
ncbi:MAG TPA: hypothetical protein VE669_00605 [Actinomycetota bacterium]|nr:hypothetical protein [Actinomycetota bacterium]